MKADADGLYAVSTPQQLYWFAAYANKVDAAAGAYLTADIDFSGYTAKGVMIGEVENVPYSGTFDGREHSIKIAYDTDKDNVALFRFINGAAIRNLLITGSVSTTARYAGGILRRKRGHHRICPRSEGDTASECLCGKQSQLFHDGKL